MKQQFKLYSVVYGQRPLQGQWYDLFWSKTSTDSLEGIAVLHRKIKGLMHETVC